MRSDIACQAANGLLEVQILSVWLQRLQPREAGEVAGETRSSVTVFLQRLGRFVPDHRLRVLYLASGSDALYLISGSAAFCLISGSAALRSADVCALGV